MLEQKPALIHRCQLKANEQVTGTWHCLKLHAPDLCGARPGQFVHVRVGASSDPLLRRPFSIHHVVAEKNEIWLLVRSVGAGTELLLQARPGAVLDLLGPLGNGFPAVDEAAPALLAGGGIGLAPLYYLAWLRRQAGLPFELLIGAASCSDLPADDYFAAQDLHPLYATEDGSHGYRGLLTGLLEQRLREGTPPARIHACGPLPMLAGVVELGRRFAVPTHVSLESHLACGVGACLGCAFPFKKGGQIEYRRVCKEGPVFNGEEVCFEI